VVSLIRNPDSGLNNNYLAEFLAVKTKQYLLIALTALFIPLLTAPLRAFVNIQTSSLLGFVAYFTIAIYWFSPAKKSLPLKTRLLALITGFLLFELSFRIAGLRSAFLSLPEAFMHFLGIAMAYLFSTRNRATGIVCSLSGLVLVIMMYLFGYDAWIQKLKSYFGKVMEPAPSFVMTTIQNEQLRNADFRNKLLVLDFWTTSCSPCFSSFPMLQKLFDTCQTREDMRIYAVNVPIEGDTAGKALQLLKSLHYTFPLIIAGEDSLEIKLRIYSYPTVLVIKNGSWIIYRGDLNGIGEIMDEAADTH